MTIRMKANMIVVIILTWTTCGIIAAGLFNASFENGFKWSTQALCQSQAARSQSFSIVVGLLGGPLSLVASLATTGFGHKGFNLRRLECFYCGQKLPGR